MKPYEPRFGRPRTAASGALQALSTAQLLALYERHFGPLDPKTKTRILAATDPRERGQGSRGMDGLAA